MQQYKHQPRTCTGHKFPLFTYACLSKEAEAQTLIKNSAVFNKNKHNPEAWGTCKAPLFSSKGKAVIPDLHEEPEYTAGSSKRGPTEELLLSEITQSRNRLKKKKKAAQAHNYLGPPEDETRSQHQAKSAFSPPGREAKKSKSNPDTLLVTELPGPQLSDRFPQVLSKRGL